jgi:ArsR family transcriptional regulator, arsenate/arsenite/antimonite-responsive transcriptional repressor
MNEIKKAARVFKVLSAETRVRMIALLKNRSLCVNALARWMNITPAAVSQHLRVLRDAGIVSGEKKGYFVHYRVNNKKLAEWNDLVKILLETREEKGFFPEAKTQSTGNDDEAWQKGFSKS